MANGKTIKINHMAKIYGHASLEVKIRGRSVRQSFVE